LDRETVIDSGRDPLIERAEAGAVEWATLHQDELLNNWRRLHRDEPPVRIAPVE
jgi:hypothetical protein